MFIQKKILLICIVLFLYEGVFAKNVLSIESFDSTQAASRWVKQETAPQAQILSGALRLDLPFSKLTSWRYYWDGKYSLDLSGADRIRMKIRAGNSVAIGQLMFYLKSGSGWYGLEAPGASMEWRTVEISLKQLSPEGTPIGLSQIDAIRIGATPGGNIDTWLEVDDIEAIRGLSVSDAGLFASFTSRDQFLLWVKDSLSTVNQSQIELRLNQAKSGLDSISGDTLSGVNQRRILMAQHLYKEVYALGQKSIAKPEFRMFWIHQGNGVRGKSGILPWGEVMPQIKSSGFNAIFPNVVWSGLAFYPSEVVPDSVLDTPKKDYLREVLDTAKALGIDVHAWKVMFQFSENWLAPNGVSEPFRKAGRLQIDGDGVEQPWLSPCDAENVKYEVAQFTELARKYPDLAGVHLDYIRYNSTNVDFNLTCKTKFMLEKSLSTINWPADVKSGGKYANEYADFRRDLITRIVREVHDSVKAISSGKMAVSAAVFPNPVTAKSEVLQDWTRWANEGLIDFLCPMAYTSDAAQLDAWIQAEQASISNKIPIYPGIGAFITDVAGVTEQIEVTRKNNTDGFSVFQLDGNFLNTISPFIGSASTYSGLISTLPDTRSDFLSTLPAETPLGDTLAYTPNQILWVDQFEKVDEKSLLGTSWYAGSDENSSIHIPWRITEDSNSYARMEGHLAKQASPWPYANLCLPFPYESENGADLSAFESIGMRVRGDGKKYAFSLLKTVVKDYGNFRYEFTTSPTWKYIQVPLSSLSQPSWALKQQPIFSDVTQLCFIPSVSISDQDYKLEIDQIQLLPKGVTLPTLQKKSETQFTFGVRSGKVYFSADQLGQASIQILNLNGQMIYTHQDQVKLGRNEWTIPLKQGVYFVVIHFQNQSHRLIMVKDEEKALY